VDQLILKRASASRLSGEWDDDDYDVLAEAIVVGRIMKAAAAAPALILESSPGELAAEPCSGACREASCTSPHRQSAGARRGRLRSKKNSCGNSFWFAAWPARRRTAARRRARPLTRRCREFKSWDKLS